ncbi:MAG: prepilin-type N-terminal cleavage/methylation domain-containing protein [Lachnospiraceae bacterium]|nr:prepilin-type N-terminal cleavage/methylation domain-containing protein [Lachnospiraceae bacterium]
MKRKAESGFSLIELLIAITVMVLLVGLIAPQVIRYVDRAREVRDMQTLDSIYEGINAALTDEDAYDSFMEQIAETGGKVTWRYGAVDIESGDGAVVSKDNLYQTDPADPFTIEYQAVMGNRMPELVSKRARDKVIRFSFINGQLKVWVARNGTKNEQRVIADSKGNKFEMPETDREADEETNGGKK